jgi:hypothetical protein
MVPHPALLTAGLLACILHCLIRTLRWYRVSDVSAIGVYSVVFPKLPDPYDPVCVRLTRDVARTYERELRWHSGSVARLFPAFHFHLQWFTILVAFPLLWFSGASRWLMLAPVGVGAASWWYFHIRGWRWLQAGCARYRTRNQNGTGD